MLILMSLLNKTVNLWNMLYCNFWLLSLNLGVKFWQVEKIHFCANIFPLPGISFLSISVENSSFFLKTLLFVNSLLIIYTVYHLSVTKYSWHLCLKGDKLVPWPVIQVLYCQYSSASHSPSRNHLLATLY